MGLMSIDDFNAMTGQHGFGSKSIGVKNLTTGKPIPSKPIEGDIGEQVNYIGQWQTFTNVPLFAHRDSIVRALVEGKNVYQEIIDSYKDWKWSDKDGGQGTLKEAVESYGGKMPEPKGKQSIVEASPAESLKSEKDNGIQFFPKETTHIVVINGKKHPAIVTKNTIPGEKPFRITYFDSTDGDVIAHFDMNTLEDYPKSFMNGFGEKTRISVEKVTDVKDTPLSAPEKKSPSSATPQPEIVEQRASVGQKKEFPVTKIGDIPKPEQSSLESEAGSIKLPEINLPESSQVNAVGNVIKYYLGT